MKEVYTLIKSADIKKVLSKNEYMRYTNLNKLTKNNKVIYSRKIKNSKYRYGYMNYHSIHHTYSLNTSYSRSYIDLTSIQFYIINKSPNYLFFENKLTTSLFILNEMSNYVIDKFESISLSDNNFLESFIKYCKAVINNNYNSDAYRLLNEKNPTVDLADLFGKHPNIYKLLQFINITDHIDDDFCNDIIYEMYNIIEKYNENTLYKALNEFSEILYKLLTTTLVTAIIRNQTMGEVVFSFNNSEVNIYRYADICKIYNNRANLQFGKTNIEINNVLYNCDHIVGDILFNMVISMDGYADVYNYVYNLEKALSVELEKE